LGDIIYCLYHKREENLREVYNINEVSARGIKNKVLRRIFGPKKVTRDLKPLLWLKMIKSSRAISHVSWLKTANVSGTISDPEDGDRDGPRHISDFQPADMTDSPRRFFQSNRRLKKIE
jgi:hypothetical protein